MKSMKEQVAKWLRNALGVTDVSPVTVTLGKQTWKGAIYTRHNERRYYLISKRSSHVFQWFEGNGDMLPVCSRSS